MDKITEEELQRRRAAAPPIRDAGPDDPIYTGGLCISTVCRLKPASSTPSAATPAGGGLPDGEPTALSLAEVTSRVWLVNPEGALALTPQERRAVELYVSRHYTDPWQLKKILNGGWEHCLWSAWEGPNLYGLA